ncbi:hypothetical protein AB672_03055 [Xylella taiwanensis]|nr:hypothetical protein AB672_03055 [Xylella taiwanensis]
MTELGGTLAELSPHAIEHLDNDAVTIVNVSIAFASSVKLNGCCSTRLTGVRSLCFAVWFGQYDVASPLYKRCACADLGCQS